MTKRWDAITVGEIYVDHVFSGLTHWPEPGEEVFTRTYVREVGGGAAITACGLGQLDRRTAVFGVIGIEEEGWIARRIGAFGVNSGHLLAIPAATGVTMSVSVHSERSFYSFAGANELLMAHLQAPHVLDELRLARHVHFAVPLERRLARRLLPELRAAGASVSMDVGWQPAWTAEPENLDTCREVDFFLPNEREARVLTGLQAAEDVLKKLNDMSLGNTILKLGSRGAMAIEDGCILRVPSPLVDVVDTTGAGDAFDAGLIDAFLDRAELGSKSKRKMIERASACGSLSTRKAGALEGLPTREELLTAYD